MHLDHVLTRGTMPGEATIPPGWWIAWMAYLAFHLALWASSPLLLGKPVPKDNREQLRWSASAEWGYVKHPPLPTLLLIAFEQVLPPGIPLTFALGGFEVGLLLAAAAYLARLSLDVRSAWVAPLWITCIVHYNVRLHFFNHNTALMVAGALALICLWRAVQSDRLGGWIGLGACWGLGALSKYQMAIVIACNLAFLATTRRIPLSRAVRGIAISSVVCGAMIVPHVRWLFQNDFTTFRYASGSLAAALSIRERLWDCVAWNAHQLGRCAYLLILMGSLGWIAGRRREQEPETGGDAELANRFWSIHTFGPFALMGLMSLLLGVDLQAHWGTPFLWSFPIWALTTPWGRRVSRLPALWIFSGVLIVHLVILIGFIIFP